MINRPFVFSWSLFKEGGGGEYQHNRLTCLNLEQKEQQVRK